jgi:hypothetical protein
MGWPEVISNLTTERTQAETCVGLIKSRSEPASIDSAKLTYVTAKAGMDGVIAGLETVLGEGGKPASLPAGAAELGGRGKQPQDDLRRGLCDRYAKYEGRLGRDRKRGGRRGGRTGGQQDFRRRRRDLDALRSRAGQARFRDKEDQVGGCEMARVRRHCQEVAAAFAVLGGLFLIPAFAEDQGPNAGTDLYDRPVLAIDPGMHTAKINAQAVDVEGRFAVTGSTDRTVRVWAVADGKLLRTI